jgi:ATP-dependent DNA helicase RecG
MTIEELDTLVKTLREVGADLQAIEVKAAKHGLPERLWETLSAFANTPGGGIILLGLDEASGFQTVGVRDPAKIQKELANLCDNMEPPLRPIIDVLQYEGKRVVVAEVPEIPSDQKPCYYKGAGPFHGAFIRVADGNRRLTEYEVRQFWESRHQPRYDRSPVPNRSIGDLDRDRLQAFLERVRHRNPDRFRDWDDERLMLSLGVLTRCNNGLCPTLAGYLAFGIYPQDEFPQLHLSIVRYPTLEPGAIGPSGERFLDNVKVEGNLPDMLLSALKNLDQILRKHYLQRGFFVEEVPEYPREFLRESIVNALIHRDYSPQAQGSPVQIRIFPDRIEIENPGGLFGPVTVDRLGEPGLMATRNATLVRIAEDLPVETNRMMCENRGTGIITMIEALRNANLSPPQFEDKRTTFLVRAFNSSLLDEESLHWLNRISRHVALTESQRLALLYCRRYERLTHSDYRRLNPRIDTPQATRELQDLVNKGLLMRYGVRRWAFYVLSEKVEKLEKMPQRQDHRREIVALLRERKEPLSAREIANTLNLKLQTVLRWLNILRKEGIVGITTKSPKSRHTRYYLKQMDEQS